MTNEPPARGRIVHSTALEANSVMTGPEKFWWYFGCVVTFGGLYFHKLSIKRGALEALLAHQAYAEIPRV
jgi:hypothetical protein